MKQFSYLSFLDEKDALSFEECQAIHQMIIDGVGNDEEMRAVWTDFLEASVTYAHTRSLWFVWDASKRRDEDDKRTTQHNKVIYTLKLLSRYMEQSGTDSAWFSAIENNRKQIGDFACYIAYVYAVNAR